MTHLSIEILKVVGVFLFPILFVIFFFKRNKATNIDIAKFYDEKNQFLVSQYFLQKEFSKRERAYIKNLEEGKLKAIEPIVAYREAKAT